VREFFQGWRRKTGLALLAMALLLTVAWMRGAVYHDQVALRYGRTSHFFSSVHGQVRWERTIQSTSRPANRPRPPIIKWNSRKTPKNLVPPSREEGTAWRWTWGWVYIGTLKEEDRREIWVIPYWSTVLPLTLISAFLIFSKPRQPKSMKEPKRA
jgi:hypothetical protein